MKGLPARFLVCIIQAYRKYVSPGLGAHCRYTPTCSEYAIEAIRLYGACKGLLLAIWRVLRCNPFSKGGYDPVPPK
ncbi:MAG: membrane protein insertion efficiency factor YidD [Christensenellaceae bacterium]|nr:membrane protein insertion efficiency factor YidD [Christensenellaceae bacterium]